MIPPVELKQGDVHVWIGRTADWSSAADQAPLRAALSQCERDRAARFLFDRDRDVFVLSHAMLREALSASTSRPPQSWQFIESSYGKPRLAPGQVDLPLEFNLSHTPGLAACAVTLNLETGIDVENVERKANEDDLAAHSFSQREQEFLRQLPADARRRRFFDIWTLKEAYIKARGMGLSIPLDSFSIVLEENAPPSIEFQSADSETAEGWSFFQWHRDPYIVSLAVRCETPVTTVVHLYQPGG